MRTLSIWFVCVMCSAACASGARDRTSPAKTTSLPASSSCAQMDPAGTWTLRSDQHSPEDFTLHRDNTVALHEGTLSWDWERDVPEKLEGCIVRFEQRVNGEQCEYALVETRASVEGYAWCCEVGEPNEGVERAICNIDEVTGIARLNPPS